MIATIVDAGKASYLDLRDNLTLEEAWDIWEIIAISRYNEWLEVEEAKRKAKQS